MPDVKEQIKNDYLSGISPKKLAEKYDTSLNTIKSWIKRYGWAKLKGEQGVPSTIRGAPREKDKKETEKEAIVEEVEHVMENTDLTDKQRLFCIYYVKCFNATKAYQKAYKCSYETAVTNGPRLLGNARIKKEIQELKQSRMNREMLDESDIFQKYMDIAFSDITDYAEFGREKVPVMGMYGPVKVKDKKTGKNEILMQEVNTVRLRESSEVDGTLISEIKQGKDGVSIKLLDKMKALDWLAKHMDIATEEQKARIELLKAKAKGGEQNATEDKVRKLFEAIGGALDAESE